MKEKNKSLELFNHEKIFINALKTGDLEAVKWHLSKYPDIAKKSYVDDWTPLHYLASQGTDTRDSHTGIAKILFEFGANPNAKTRLGWTPLHMIAINGAAESLEILKLLFDHGADPFLTSGDGISTWRIFWQHGIEIKKAIEARERIVRGGK